MKTNIVTVVIPVFERTAFFEKAIESILNQTIVPKILVVDNNSSHKIFEEYCYKKSIPYFRNEKNIGMFGNWNRGFEHAQSEFVLILGDDDLLEKSYIETFLKRKKKYPNLDVFFTDFSILSYPTKAISAHKHIMPFGFMKNSTKIQEYGILHGLSFPVVTSTIRKSKFKGFYKDEHGSNDWEWAYLQAKDLIFFGENQKLLFRGHHSSNDSTNVNTIMRTSLSMAHIYEELAKITEDITLQKKSFRRSRNTFLYFLYTVSKTVISELSSSNYKYAQFFNKKYSKNIVFRILLKLQYQIKQKLIGFFFITKLLKFN